MDLPPLHGGALLRRYKRFLADVRLDDGREVTAHCANPGAMTSCIAPGWRVWLSHHPDPKRKLHWSLQQTVTPEGVRVLVNTALPNAVAAEAIAAGGVPELAGYAELRAEVPYGEEGSRVDLRLRGPGRPDAWVEIKSVTLKVGPEEGAFPDAVSARATRHLRELAAMRARGDRAVLLYLVGRGDVARVRPADEIDPAYGRALREAASAGVEVLARGVVVGADALRLGPALEVGL